MSPSECINDNLIYMTLAEDKYHQVKRMVAAIANRVEGLKRIQIGALKLPDDLKVGEGVYFTLASTTLCIKPTS